METFVLYKVENQEKREEKRFNTYAEAVEYVEKWAKSFVYGEYNVVGEEISKSETIIKIMYRKSSKDLEKSEFRYSFVVVDTSKETVSEGGENMIDESGAKLYKEKEKVYKTASGIKFITTKENTFKGYDATIAGLHLRNYGVIFLDAKYKQPIDDEYELEEIESYYRKNEGCEGTDIGGISTPVGGFKKKPGDILCCPVCECTKIDEKEGQYSCSECGKKWKSGNVSEGLSAKAKSDTLMDTLGWALRMRFGEDTYVASVATSLKVVTSITVVGSKDNTNFSSYMINMGFDRVIKLEMRKLASEEVAFECDDVEWVAVFLKDMNKKTGKLKGVVSYIDEGEVQEGIFSKPTSVDLAKAIDKELSKKLKSVMKDYTFDISESYVLTSANVKGKPLGGIDTIINVETTLYVKEPKESNGETLSSVNKSLVKALNDLGLSSVSKLIYGSTSNKQIYFIGTFSGEKAVTNLVTILDLKEKFFADSLSVSGKKVYESPHDSLYSLEKAVTKRMKPIFKDNDGLRYEDTPEVILVMGKEGLIRIVFHLYLNGSKRLEDKLMVSNFASVLKGAGVDYVENMKVEPYSFEQNILISGEVIGKDSMEKLYKDLRVRIYSIEEEDKMIEEGVKYKVGMRFKTDEGDVFTILKILDHGALMIHDDYEDKDYKVEESDLELMHPVLVKEGEDSMRKVFNAISEGEKPERGDTKSVFGRYSYYDGTKWVHDDIKARAWKRSNDREKQMDAIKKDPTKKFVEPKKDRKEIRDEKRAAKEKENNPAYHSTSSYDSGSDSKNGKSERKIYNPTNHHMEAPRK